MIDKKLLVNSYGERFNYLADNIDKTKIVGKNNENENAYDYREMIFDYLDSLSKTRLLEISKRTALKELHQFAKEHKEEYLLDNGETSVI